MSDHTKSTKKRGRSSTSRIRAHIRKLIPHKIKQANRSLVLAGSLTLVLALVGGIAMAFSSSTEPQEVVDQQQEVVEAETAPQMSATLTLAQGVVEYRTDDEVWVDAQTDLDIVAGMSLQTVGGASRAEVALGDGSVLRLDASSRVTFETLGMSRVVIVQGSGHTYNRVINSEDRTYVVQTNNAQFQSVGTAFRINAGGDEESAEVFHSSVRETTLNLNADEGKKLIAKSFVNPSKDGQIESIDIEQLKKDAFITWNREKDQASSAFKSQLGFLSDFDGPSITISNPKDGSTIDVASGSTQGKVKISGTVPRGTRLTVQSKSQSGSAPLDVTVSDSGAFVTPELVAPLGTSVFELIGTDNIGNKTTVNVSYVFAIETAVQQQGIALTVNDSDPDELLFEWGLVGMTTPDGVKLVYGQSSGPTYPDSDSSYIATASFATKIIKASDSGKTYYFRVCRYDADNNSCDVYSNEVVVTIP